MKSRGFTLIELLVVISIIGLLSSVVLASLNSARIKARDAKRLADMQQLQTALDFYYDKFGTYPAPNSDAGANFCGGWDATVDGVFVSALSANNFLPGVAKDPKGEAVCGNYAYYHYSATPASPYNGCTKDFYVIGVRDMEGSVGRYPTSPGFACNAALRNWQDEFDWVTGKFD